MLALLGLALAACDGAETDAAQATTEAAADARVASEQGEPIARYDEGTLTLAISTTEAREIVMGATDKLIQNVEGVTFQEPVVEMVGDRPYLMMRGERLDGNCALAFVRLASEEALSAGTARSISEARTIKDKSIELYKTQGGSCSGDPCNQCTLFTGNGGEMCDCTGSGPGGSDGWCNHSTGG